MASEITSFLLSQNEKLRDIAKKFLIPEKVPEQDSRKLAEATAAVEVVLSVVNIFNTIYSNQRHTCLAAITDLTFALNSNVFWVKNSGYLMPLLNGAINAALDYKEAEEKLAEEKLPEPLWDKFDYHNKFAWLEILPAIVFLVHGFGKMRVHSTEIKKSFEAFVK